MKILAFSDWRVQSLDMIINIVERHRSDAILYAGDDLIRFVSLDKFLLLKTLHHSLTLNYPNFKPELSLKNRFFTQNFKNLIKKIPLTNNTFLTKLKIPFFYVNGNDDPLLYIDNNYYMKIHSGYFSVKEKNYVITETPKGKITIKKTNDISLPFSDEYDDIFDEDIETDMFSEEIEDKGIYTPITPSFGKVTINKENEKITIFGCECEYGLENKIKNKPEEYADIYLSHIPPLGTLDLSVRFGMSHIGSKKLLDAVKKFHPKLVICGHSHIWGGNNQKIGDTLVVNVSSQDSDSSYGNYALIDTNNWKTEVKKVENKNLFKIRGFNPIVNKLFKKRIVNRNNRHILDDSDEILKNIDYWGKQMCMNTKRVKERIESLKWKKPKIIGKITINTDNYAFVDVETGLADGPEPGKLWLIGLWYKDDLKQFLFPKEINKFIT